MARIEHSAHRIGPPDENSSLGAPRRVALRLARLRSRVQDWIAGPDERLAEERGWTATRSASGWSVTVRDPRFDRRHVCATCGGSGRHRITGADCTDCSGVGVVTEAERGERE